MEAIAVLDTGCTVHEHAGFQGIVDTFIKSLDVSASSKATYERALRPFMEWIRENEVRIPTRTEILSYRTHLQEQGLSAFTISGYMTVVRKFFEWAESEKHYPNIAKGIKGAKKPKGFRKDPLTVSQILELLGSIDQSTDQGKRDYALLNLLVRTGLRTIEAIRANVGDIRQEGGEAVLWIQGKGRDSKDEFVLLTQETLKPIRAYFASRAGLTPESALFASGSHRNGGQRLTTRSIRRIVKDRLSGIGIDDGRLTAHSLRHTAITLSLIGGASLQEAQALGRHANITTTMVYAHNIDRVANAAERKIDSLLAGMEG